MNRIEFIIEIFCYIMNVFAVTFLNLMHPCRIQVLYIFLKKRWEDAAQWKLMVKYIR